MICRFFFQAEDGIRDVAVTGVQTCALPIYPWKNRLPVRIKRKRDCRTLDSCWNRLKRVRRYYRRFTRRIDRKSTRLNSSHGYISYAVFCLKKKKKKKKKKK